MNATITGLLVGLALMALPFALGLTAPAMVTGVVVGALVVGTALQAMDTDGRPLPVSAHHAADYGFVIGLAGAAIVMSTVDATAALLFGGIAASSADGNMVRLSPGLFQPIAADDVAVIVADVALAAPRNGIIEIAGPERAPFNEIVARYLKAVGDPREVVRDPEARYWGGRVEERSLVPLGPARLGGIGVDEWLRRSPARSAR